MLRQCLFHVRAMLCKHLSERLANISKSLVNQAHIHLSGAYVLQLSKPVDLFGDPRLLWSEIQISESPGLAQMFPL